MSWLLLEELKSTLQRKESMPDKKIEEDLDRSSITSGDADVVEVEAILTSIYKLLLTVN